MLLLVKRDINRLVHIINISTKSTEEEITQPPQMNKMDMVAPLTPFNEATRWVCPLRPYYKRATNYGYSLLIYLFIPPCSRTGNTDMYTNIKYHIVGGAELFLSQRAVCALSSTIMCVLPAGEEYNTNGVIPVQR